MRTFIQRLPAALLCVTALPLIAAVPGAETVTPAQIATADRPAASREEAQKPRPGEQDLAEAIAAETAAPQTAAPVATANSVSNAQVAFAPTDGARFERLLTSQSSSSTNADAISLHEIRTQLEERWEKSGDQWLLHCTPMDASVQGEVAMVAETEQVLLSQPYTVVFNSQGEVIEVRGFDAISEKIKDALPSDAPEQFIAMFTPESMRANVAKSQNYQFNWLFNKQWRLGERHVEELSLPASRGKLIEITKVSTISAIDATTLILSIENSGQTDRETFSEKGTVTLDTASGQLRQLQKTRLIAIEMPGQDGNTVSHKNTEVLTITWQPIH